MFEYQRTKFIITYWSALFEMLKEGIEPKFFAFGVHIRVEVDLKNK